MNVLIPFVLVLVAIFGISQYLAYSEMFQNIESDLKLELENAEELLYKKNADDIDMMDLLGDAVMRNESIKSAMRSQDREALLEHSSPLFEQMKAQYSISHLYFLDPERRVVLRVHNPDIHGDNIDRVSARRAAETGKPTSDLELGVLGDIALRLVLPWFDGDKLIGYVESAVYVPNLHRADQTKSGAGKMGTEHAPARHGSQLGSVPCAGVEHATGCGNASGAGQNPVDAYPCTPAQLPRNTGGKPALPRGFCPDHRCVRHRDWRPGGAAR